MRSRRSRLELGCRIAAFALIGWLIGTSLFPPRPIRTERAAAATIAPRLAAWTRMPPASELHVDLDTVPDPWIVDWLAALRASGHIVRWSGSPSPAAIVAEPVGDPRAHVRVGVASPNGASVVLSDDAALIDTMHVASLGALESVPLVVGALHASVGGQSLEIARPAAVRSRAVFVVGRASWEGKYVATALEEDGWSVIARFAVAPGVEVTEGAPMLDTSRVAAVIALDSTVSRLGGALAGYVRDGGGLILAGTAASAANVRAVAPGVVGGRIRHIVQPAQSIALGATGFYPVTSLAENAVPLERRDGVVAVAVRRIDAGRVMQVGYDDTWRWRMAGAEGSVDAHRTWWSRVVDAVAYVPASPDRAQRASARAAPVARLVERLGPPASASRSNTSGGPDRRILLTLIMICLLQEWSSRRLRGLR